MTDRPADVPLMIDPGSTPAGATVVDLSEVRVRWGRTKTGTKVCEHKKLIYSTTERRVWCEDCERTIDNFDAMMTMVKHFGAMETAARYKLKVAEEAKQATLVRRAAKSLDRTWGHKMAACCPHCRRGLLPEDFEGGGAAIARDLEIARRKRESTL